MPDQLKTPVNEPVAVSPVDAGSAQCEAEEDTFNKWNRDIDDYAPTLWDAYLFGLKQRSDFLAKRMADKQAAYEAQIGELERAIVGFKRDGAYAKGWNDHIASILADWLNREQALRKAAAELTFWLEHAREADMHESARGALAVVKQIRALLSEPNASGQPHPTEHDKSL